MSMAELDANTPLGATALDEADGNTSLEPNVNALDEAPGNSALDTTALEAAEGNTTMLEGLCG